MSGRVRIHRSNNAQIIYELRCVRKQAADFQTTRSMLSKFERRLHEMTDRSAVRSYRRVALVGCAVEPREGRFVIEGIDMTRRAVHEKKDGMLRLGRKMRPLRIEQIGNVAACKRLISRACVRCEKSVAREQIDQRQTCKTAADFPEEFATASTARRRVRDESANVHFSRNRQTHSDSRSLGILAPKPRGARSMDPWPVPRSVFRLLVSCTVPSPRTPRPMVAGTGP